MKRSIHYTLLVVSFYFFQSYGQELPPINNFKPAEYNAGYQNWSISQSVEKLIYVANNEGLLEFNGSEWKLYPSPNETIMRSVKVVGGRIYTGCYMEFGFWKKDELGSLHYTSLSKQLSDDIIEDEEFWHILEVDNHLIFQSLNRIYIYNIDDEEINIIDSDEEIINIYDVDDIVYFQRLNVGIFKIENGKQRLISDNSIFKKDEVIQILSQEDQTLVITRNSGIYSLNEKDPKNRLSPKIFSNVSIYCAIKMSNDHIVLGTISNGLLYLNKNLELVYEINQQNGLSNNTVLSAFEDIDGNLWTALDYGLGFINIISPIKAFKDIDGEIGSVYATAVHDNTLYLGTNQGLYYKKSSENSFRFIQGTEGQVWNLTLIDDVLFCGHHKGTFTVQNGSVTLIASIPGTWGVSEIENKTGLLLQGNYDGLYVLERKGITWEVKNKIEGFNNSARHFETLNDQVFINHEYKGLFILKLDTNFSKVESIRVEPELKGSNSSIAKFKGDILFAFKNGIFIFDSVQDVFIRSEELSLIYDEKEYISGKMVLNESKDIFWIFTRSNIIQVSSGSFGKAPKLLKLPLTLDMRGDVEEYQNIVNYNSPNQYLAGNSSGYIVLNTEQFKIADFNITINEVINGVVKDLNNEGSLVNQLENGFFDSDENNFQISYYAPVYQKLFKTYYQFRLIGIYDNWSDWTDESTVFFENLPPGDYQFSVRAKAGNKISSNTASYSFRISRPWYLTNLMIIVYVIGMITFSVIIHHIYKSYYKGQRARLIEKNKHDIELTLLQNEKEIIKLKNEQLKEDFKTKSKELAASTMSVVRKNEILNEIKDQLINIEDKSIIKPVIKVIDKNLNHTGNWELFKEAFDNVDSEFLKKLKTQHPNLSPNDLKLCAYLRLNLSSKEVAQLINISPRSVEVKRYRLRKKLNLTNDENLIDHILNI